MILNRNESEVTVLGEVQKYKVGIDERNINHIVTILSSNLYSHPMQSFLRETVANAIDSHLEAGVDEPIIITITDQDLSIRDFGTGISPERFQEIYTNIGSSTKRKSNDYIGSFGIGRFSCLSVSDLANITSFYNGKAYYYVMNKDIDQLHIDLILEKDTDEHNGVEVKIPFKEPLNSEDWRCLAYIKNIFIEDERKYVNGDQGSIIESFNKRKVYTYKTFKTMSIEYPYIRLSHYTEVLVGNIPYRVDYNTLWDDNSLYEHWEDAFKKVSPFIPIGEVDITPNREGLLYSERTKTALRKAYNDAITELTQLWEASCNEEKTNFKDFAYAIKEHYSNVLKLYNVEIEVDNDLPYKVKYKDFPEYNFKELKEIIRTLLYTSTDNVIACVSNNEWRKGRNITEASIDKVLNKCEEFNTTTIAVPNSYGFSSKYIKGFLTEQFPNKKVMIVKEVCISPSRIKHFIRTAYGFTTMSDSKRVHLIVSCIRELLKYFNQHIRKWDIINSPEYKQYKEDNKEEKIYIRNNTEIPCHIWYPHDSGYTTETETPSNLIKRLTTTFKHHRIVYASLDNPFIFGFKGINYPRLIIIALAQNNYALAEKGLFPDFVRPIEELYSADNKILQKMATAEFIKSKTPIQDLPSAFPQLARHRSSKLRELINKYQYTSVRYDYRFEGAHNILKVIPEEKYDIEMLSLYNQIKKYQNIIQKLSGHSGQFFYYFLMKAKKLRLDYEYYKCIRHDIENITNLL